MNKNRYRSNHPATCNIIDAHVAPFTAGLGAAGYAANTICTKRAALRRFSAWRRRLRPSESEPDESEAAEFVRSSAQLGPKRHCLASTALSAFLEHVRSRKAIKACAPKVPVTASSLLERRYADFLRDEKGLTERSLQVCLPLVPELLLYLVKQYGTASVRRLNASILRAFLFERARDRSSECGRLLVLSCTDWR
jgi:hypothetical protein